MAENAGTYQLRRFTPSYEALGVVIEYIGRQPPFDQYRVGKLLAALKHQIAHGHHVCAFRNETLVGYCGWLPITEELGRLWLQDKAELAPVPPEHSNAFAVTVVRGENPDVVRAIIRATRRQTVGQRAFFRRDYASETRSARLQSVLNFSLAEPGLGRGLGQSDG
jgi:hypothetical protein